MTKNRLIRLSEMDIPILTIVSSNRPLMIKCSQWTSKQELLVLMSRMT